MSGLACLAVVFPGCGVTVTTYLVSAPTALPSGIPGTVAGNRLELKLDGLTMSVEALNSEPIRDRDVLLFPLPMPFPSEHTAPLGPPSPLLGLELELKALRDGWSLDPMQVRLTPAGRTALTPSAYVGPGRTKNGCSDPEGRVLPAERESRPVPLPASSERACFVLAFDVPPRIGDFQLFLDGLYRDGAPAGLAAVSFHEGHVSPFFGQSSMQLPPLLWFSSGIELLRWNVRVAATERLSIVSFGPDGQAAALAKKGGLRIWDAETGRPLLSAEAGRAMEDGPLAVSPDGGTVAAAGDGGRVVLWNTRSGGLSSLAGHHDRITSFAFSRDGRTLAAGGADGTISLWDLATGREERLLRGHRRRITGLAFGPVGSALASASPDGEIRLWDPTTGAARKLSVAVGAKTAVTLDFSSDGRAVASGNADWPAPSLFKAEGGTVIAPKPLPWFGGVTSVVFSSGGERLATAGARGVVLWEIRDLRPLGLCAPESSFPPFPGEAGVGTAAFLSNGRGIAFWTTRHADRIVECDVDEAALRR